MVRSTHPAATPPAQPPPRPRPTRSVTTSHPAPPPLPPSLLQPPPRTILTAAALAAGAHALQLPSPPSAAGIFVVKSTASGTAILEEYLAGAPSQWYPLQSLTVTGCALSTAGAQGYGSVAADGTAAVFPCGATGSCARAVARVGASGTVDVTPSGWYTTTTCTFLPRGAATEDGNVTWAADAQAIYRGAFSAAASAIASGNTYYHALVAVLGGARALLVSGCAGTTAPCPSGSIYYSDPALPGSVDDSFNFPLAGTCGRGAWEGATGTREGSGRVG